VTDGQTDRIAIAIVVSNTLDARQKSLAGLTFEPAVWIPWLRIGLLAGCRKRRLNQASLNPRGLI